MRRDEVLAPNTPTPDLTNISRVESRRLYRQALKREKEITDSSQNPTEA